MTRATLEIPMRVVNESNRRDHWGVKARRVKAQRRAVALAWRAAWMPVVGIVKPSSVRLTRLAARTLDTDGLVRAFKAVRDQIAEECGFDDGDPGVRWQYAQEKAKGYAIRVEVTW